MFIVTDTDTGIVVYYSHDKEAALNWAGPNHPRYIVTERKDA